MLKNLKNYLQGKGNTILSQEQDAYTLTFYSVIYSSPIVIKGFPGDSEVKAAASNVGG